ncbi:hypothetical protein FRAAL4091 [Frankia alni ACN14a]|uniref:Uncharacterized protein n=1 Tax=Frankia alni (strain DSM 45986 / CECT 9034 / ACN14a) TaxID=326424 RepID=Q0RID6_FRAAA|nr:hypothetical protein FRAAL4091 [Frankia alni ACN14a]
MARPTGPTPGEYRGSTVLDPMGPREPSVFDLTALT